MSLTRFRLGKGRERVKVFVTGGTGYVGQTVIDCLLQAGHDVTALQREHATRRLEKASIQRVVGDVFDEASLLAGMKNQDAVIHLVGIIREQPRQGFTMSRVHVDGTQNVLKAAMANGIGRFLHMSALNVRNDAVANYHRTKWEAEERVRQSGMSHTIFRPSVIFGKGGPGPEFVGQLVDLVRKAPIVPVVGSGQFLLQPVSIQTVGLAFTRALGEKRTYNRVYEVGGPTVISYLEILERIAQTLRKPLRTVRVPVFLMKALVPLLQRSPDFPLTVDQLTMLLEGNVCADSESLYQDLQLERVPFQVHLQE